MEIVRQVEQVVEKYFNRNKSHGIEHARRVAKNATQIWEEEGRNGDLEVILLSALLHDCESGRKRKIRFPTNLHSFYSARIAKKILSELGYAKTKEVYQAILSHGITLKNRLIAKWILFFLFYGPRISQRINYKTPLETFAKYPPQSEEAKILWDADALDILEFEKRFDAGEWSRVSLLNLPSNYELLAKVSYTHLQTQAGKRIFEERMKKLKFFDRII